MVAKCKKCGGTVAHETLRDDGSVGYDVPVLRCICCGKIEYVRPHVKNDADYLTAM